MKEIGKQAIEEMAVIMRDEYLKNCIHPDCHNCEMYNHDARHSGLCKEKHRANALYNAGYRKQIVGEWVRQERKKGVISPEAVCSNCGRDVEYQVIDGKRAFENYCSHCGAKMKGGAE